MAGPATGSLLVALALLMAPGCSRPSGARLVGVWEASIDEMLAAAQARGRRVDAESFGDLSITVEYKGDGTFSFNQRTGNLETIETGTWEVTADQSGRLRIRLSTEIDGRTRTKEGEVIFDGEDRCRVLPVERSDPPLILKRKR